MDGEIDNSTKVCILVVSSLSYCYFLSSKIPKGKFRLLSLLPILSLFTVLPLFFSYLFPIGIISLFISWLANFKLLLFAFDQGPLSSHPPKSLLQFISTAILPIKIKQNKDYPSSNPPLFPLNWSIKVLLFTICVGVLDSRSRLHPKIILLLYSFVVYLLVDIIFGIGNALVRATLNMELEPTSHEPYLSTSLQDFWGRRWNLMTANVLRHTIYKPVRTQLENGLGQCASIPAVLATFLASGLMHELLFYHVSRASPTWEVTCFFVLHGVCLVVEFGLKRWLTGKFRLHWALSTPLTVGFVMVTGMWLFFPPVVRTGAADRTIDECNMMLNFVKGKLKLTG